MVPHTGTFNIISDRFNSFKGKVQLLIIDTTQRFTDNWFARLLKKVLMHNLQTLVMIVSVYLDLMLDSILLITIIVAIGPTFNDSRQFSTQIALFLFMSILVPNLITAISIAFRRPFVVMNSEQWFKWRGSTFETAVLRFAIIFLFPFVPAMIMLSSEKAKEKSQAFADKNGDDIIVSDLEEIELLTIYIKECRLAMLTFKRNELSMELVIQLTIHVIMVLLSQTNYPLKSGLETIFSNNEENKEKSKSAIIILVLSLLWSFKTSALTAMKIKAEEKNVLLLLPKSVLALRYSLLFWIRIGSIVTYFSPFLGLCGIMDHYQAEILPLDFELFMSFKQRKYEYWNPIEEEFQSVNISQLFRSQYDYTTLLNNISSLNEVPTPPSSKLYTVIGLDKAFVIFWAVFLTYAIILGIMKHFISKDFRMASFGEKLQHIIESMNMPETYSNDWDTDHELDEKGHLQIWWRVWREMALMIVMQLISNLMLLVPFFVVASNVNARHVLLEGAIGVFSEEELAYIKVKTLSWILPSVIITGALLDMILVFSYMKIAHPWKYILFHQENDREVIESAKNHSQDNKSISSINQDESATEITIEKILETVQKEILERNAKREQGFAPDGKKI